MTAVRHVRLQDVCVQDRKTVKPGEGSHLRYIGLETIEANTGQFLNGELSKTPEVPLANSFQFSPRHVLYGKLRPYLNKVALPAFEGKCSTEIIPLLPKAGLERAYLAYFLRSSRVISQVTAKTAGSRMPRADMDFILSLQIPLPSLAEQHRIIDILSRAEGIVRLRREAQKKAAEIIPALFLDMFGDPATNPKGWESAPLGNIAEVVSGVTKGRKFNGKITVLVPYLRVANVQAGYLDLAELKEIEVLPSDVQALRLQHGDVLLTEGGDFDKLGRGALWEHEVTDCIHQNHIFRVRLDRNKGIPEFFVSYLQSNKAREYFLRSAKRTTNLASINMTQLRGLPVILPPLKAQAAFLEQFQSMRAISSQQSAAAAKAEATFDALLANFFARPLSERTAV
ncbi:restriction endonuclease subunit S [Methylolobus aquaticus]